MNLLYVYYIQRRLVIGLIEEMLFRHLLVLDLHQNFVYIRDGCSGCTGQGVDDCSICKVNCNPNGAVPYSRKLF